MSILDYGCLISLPKHFYFGSVIKINIRNCGLKSLTKLKLERFYNLQILNCDKNELTDLDGLSNCTSLQKLYCHNNKITNIDGLSNCTSLQVLSCHNNKITNIDGLSNCTSLRYLWCSYNEITNLDALFRCTSLQYFYCRNNKITNLDGLSKCTSLIYLDCIENKITNLDGISNCTSLQKLECKDNQLTSLLPIRSLMNLRNLSYSGIFFKESHHPSVLRILNRIIRIIYSNIYRNMYSSNMYSHMYNHKQNVHNSEINISVNTSINNLLKVHGNSIKDEDEIISKLNEFKFSRIEDLLKYFNNKDVHYYFNMTYFEVFQLVFAEIERLDFNPKILKRLEEEIADSEVMCVTERLNRIINCLNSFSDLVSINISETSQGNAIMSLI